MPGAVGVKVFTVHIDSGQLLIAYINEKLPAAAKQTAAVGNFFPKLFYRVFLRIMISKCQLIVIIEQFSAIVCRF